MGYRFDSVNHIHYLDEIPLNGTTTVLDVLGKPLTYWASGMACAEFGWLNPKENDAGDCDRSALEKLRHISKMELKDYLALLDRAYRAHATNLKKSADKGTDLHDLAEEWIKWKMGIGLQPMFIDERIKPFVAWAEKNVRRFLYVESCVYSRKLWLGGKFDLIYVDMNGELVLGDIKSAKEAYLSHFLQMGAYDMQISENGIFDEGGTKLSDPIAFSHYAVFPLGAKKFTEPSTDHRVEMYKSGYKGLLEVFHVKKKFDEGRQNRAANAI